MRQSEWQGDVGKGFAKSVCATLWREFSQEGVITVSFVVEVECRQCYACFGAGLLRQRDEGNGQEVYVVAAGGEADLLIYLCQQLS